MSGYDKVLENLIIISRALKFTHGARDELTLHYIQHKWLNAEDNPTESELAKLALKKIKQDPSHFDLFIEMLRDTEGMGVVLLKITGEMPQPRNPLPRSFAPVMR